MLQILDGSTGEAIYIMDQVLIKEWVSEVNIKFVNKRGFWFFMVN